ncbi:hypothetical protein [Gordonia hirsuta]|uniref:hypothetical protein n=1 Tax=Gordonia hirsuta TaxID=53427 RepID=UPI001FDFD1BA|nr:hypothetical protein [Gordonia hirsuta]
MIAIVTILVIRAYLAATGYPQIGGKTLHIAHALWGGAAMIIAIIVLLSFAGRRARALAVLLGGIGFGLFLDEVGKFVTKTNDYFFAPAVSIMYVVLVVLLLVNRAIQDTRRSSPQGELSEALIRTAEAVVGGATAAERQDIRGLLNSAVAGGADPATVDEVSRVLEGAPEDPPSAADRLRARLLPGDLEAKFGRHTTQAAAWLLTAFSLAGLISASVTIAEDLDAGTGIAVSAIGRFGGSTLAFVLCVAALFLHGRNPHSLRPLRMLRAAALVTMLLTEVFDFVAEQFGALINVAIGLAALAVFSYRINFLTRRTRPAVSESDPAAAVDPSVTVSRTRTL